MNPTFCEAIPSARIRLGAHNEGTVETETRWLTGRRRVFTDPIYGAHIAVVMILICFIAPWLAMFLRGHIIQGILCIILHITLIGWIPATIWALVVTRRENAA